jgi:hypothetical protein
MGTFVSPGDIKKMEGDLLKIWMQNGSRGDFEVFKMQEFPGWWKGQVF